VTGDVEGNMARQLTEEKRDRKNDRARERYAKYREASRRYMSERQQHEDALFELVRVALELGPPGRK